MLVAKKSVIKQLLQDPKFWVLLFFIIRLVGISNPPLEIGHNWRQSLTNMIARNFYEIDANILFPRIDMAGNKTGIIGSEFPLMNYLIYLMSELFGYAHWYGRLINLCISSLGILYFGRTIKVLFNSKHALYATIILLSSIWFAFARKIMPDTFSVSLVLIGIYWGVQFLREGKYRHLLCYFVLATLGVLSKIPALTLLAGFGIKFFYLEITIKRKMIFVLVSFVIVGIVSLWYFVWVPYLLDTYDFQLYFPKGLKEGLQELVPLWSHALHKFYFSALHSYVGFALCLFGVFFLLKGKKKPVLAALAIMFLVFVAFIIKTGKVFPMHNYYIITWVPVMALVVGYGIAQLPRNWIQYLILGIIVLEGLLNQHHDFRIREDQMYKLALADIVKKEIPKDELIVVNGGLSPQLMYFAHRRGWSIDNKELKNDYYRLFLKKQGARYFVLDKQGLNIHFDRNALFEDEHFLIYDFE